MEVARSGLWAPGWYVYSKLRYWAYFSQQSVATEYLHLTEDNNGGRKDYYLEPHDSDPTVPLTRADVYDRLVLSIKHLAFVLEKFWVVHTRYSVPTKEPTSPRLKNFPILVRQ